MYRGLIDNLTYMYSFLCKGRGKMTREDMQAIANGAHVMTRTAPAVLGNATVQETAEDMKDYQECKKIDTHIDEMYVFLSNMEIC